MPVWPCACAVEPAKYAAQLVVDEPDADQRHQAPADRLEPSLHDAHLHAGGAEYQHQDGDQHQRRQRLDHGGEERQQDAASHRAAVGQHIGGDHRLAVAGPRRVQHAVGEAQECQRQRGAERIGGLEAAHGRRQLAIDLRLLLQQPGTCPLQHTGCAAGLRRARLREALLRAERALAGLGLLRLRRRRQHQRRQHQERDIRRARSMVMTRRR